MDSSRVEGSRQYHGEASSSIPAHVQAVRHSDNEQLNRPNPNSSQAPTIQNFDTQSPIYLLAKDCLRRFEGLYVALHNSHLDGPQQLTFDLGSMQSTIEDAQTRFRAWGTNIAAFRNGTFRTSLDFRLAEAPRIKYRTMQVLEDLQQYLSEVDLIARGEKINETWNLDNTSDSSDYSDEDDKDQKGKGVSFKGQTSGSDVGDLLKAIAASNASLMKLSIVIRSSATRDDYLKAASRFSNWNPFPDIGHVREKYGSAKYSSDWLLERLGKAITRRRQFLKYRIEHNDRLVGIGADDENQHDGPTKTIASTKATTFVGENILHKVREAGSDAGNSFGSATSYENTVFQGDGSPTMLTVPPPPKFAFPTRFGFPKIPFEYGQPFQCPYCFTEQTVENRSAWKTHVFRDLKPYVCTFNECEMLMFRSRNEWFTHELQSHRREWACQFCQHSPFATVSDFSKHTETAHAAILSSSPLKALIMLSEEPIDKISSTACPLCNDWETDMVRKQAILESEFPSPNKLEKKDDLHSKPRLFRRHLGRHMEQLALFALPPNHFDDLEDGSIEREEVEDDSSNKEEDDLSQGRQSANETWAPHTPELSPAQDSLELDGSKLSTASPQDDELQQHERLVTDFELGQQNKRNTRSTKDRELGEGAGGLIENDKPNIVQQRIQAMARQIYQSQITNFMSQYPAGQAPPEALNNFKQQCQLSARQKVEQQIMIQQQEQLALGQQLLQQQQQQGHMMSGQQHPSMVQGLNMGVNAEHKRIDIGDSHYERRSSTAAEPVIITNRIYNDHDDYGEPNRPAHFVAPVARERSRSSSKSRSRSRSRSRHSLKSQAKAYVMKGKATSKDAFKENDKSDYMTNKVFDMGPVVRDSLQAGGDSFEDSEEEQRDKEYKERVEEDMRKSGMTGQQIAAVLKKEKIDDGTRPMYTRMARRYLSYETLNAFRMDYTVDQDPEYILIKRWVPEYEQDFLWEHTAELRKRRRGIINTTSTSTTMLQVEGGDNHDDYDHSDVQYEIVKKKDSKSGGRRSGDN